jgi:DNA-binding CsgD family transcriptional regulator
MSQSAQLRLQDVRALVQLIAECRDRGDDPVAWRLHAAQRLAQLTGAELANLGEAAYAPDRVCSLGMAAWGWENGFDQSPIVHGLAEDGHDLRFSPLFDAYFRLPRQHFGLCLSRRDVVTDRDWYRSRYFQVIHAPCGFGHTLATFLPLRDTKDVRSGINVVRAASVRRDFRARDRALVQEAHAALVPLLGGPLAPFSEPSPADLAPRVRQVLGCLLEGDSDKQIAARLGISRFTVNQYTKTLFRHFHVQSRAELMARWIRRGQGDKWSWLN